MPDDTPIEDSGGGQTALVVAVAHLSELLGAIDSAQSRAMFLVGLSVASSSLFIAVMASLGQPWYLAVAPTAIGFWSMLHGLRTLWRVRVSQFPAPSDLLRAEGRGMSDDELAWLAVRAIANVSTAAARELARLAQRVQDHLFLTMLHLIALAAAGLGLAV